MSKPVRTLLIALAVLLVLGGGVWFLLRSPAEEPEELPDDPGSFVVNRPLGDVASVEVTNQNGGYTVTGRDRVYSVADIPADLVVEDYLMMLLDECSRVQSDRIIAEDLSKAADFGLSEPEAEVKITYTDGETLTLLLGAHEPISDSRYYRVEGEEKIRVMAEGRTVRFTMPVEKFIDFIIVPPIAGASPLSEVQDVTVSGSLMPEPVVIKAVLPDRPELQLTGLSYGALTHLVTAPGLHEANPNGMMTLATQMTGLISEGVVQYNCTEEELAAYGFAKPLLQYDFDYKNGEDAPVQSHTLRISRMGEDYIANYDAKPGVVYRILDLDFLHLQYTDLVLRWFVSPFISDVGRLTVTFPGEEYSYEISGRDAKDVRAKDRTGAVLDPAGFRKLFSLAVSAASDGDFFREEPELTGEPVLTLCYSYRNPEKADDVLRFFEAGRRRLYVEQNGSVEATCRGNFAEVLREACRALQKGESFLAEW